MFKVANGSTFETTCETDRSREEEDEVAETGAERGAKPRDEAGERTGIACLTTGIEPERAGSPPTDGDGTDSERTYPAADFAGDSGFAPGPPSRLMTSYGVHHLSPRFKGPTPRWHNVVTVALGAMSMMIGCATYSQDLERARRHYQELEFPQSLAVLRLLGEDFDALSAAERVQFAYLRGMTDFRLAETVPATGSMRTDLRACARDWLDETLTLERRAPGSLSVDQSTRVRIALAQLIDVETRTGGCLIPALSKRVSSSAASGSSP